MLGSLAPDTDKCHSRRGLQQSPLLVFDVQVQGYTSIMRALVDTGASQNYARRSSVSRNAALYGPASARHDGNISVKMADGATTTTKKVQLDLQIKFLDFKGTESFFVIDLDERYDLILGMPWLRKHQPWIDWSDQVVG
jgi:predicted aspartyl protease